MEIPKTIHYCWFGGKNKPKLIRKCIESWKLKLFDYEILEWNETNSDLSSSFVAHHYKQQNWAFVSDYVRLKVLYKYGGIYLDTDMFVIKSFDTLLGDPLFFGAEERRFISGGIMGVVENHDFLKECIIKYDSIILGAIDLRTITIPKIITSVYRKYYKYNSNFSDLIKVDDSIIYPSIYFYPFPMEASEKNENFENYIRSETYAIHLWNRSWIERNEFYYIKKGFYFRGIFSAFINIFKGKNQLNIQYLRMLGYSIKKSFDSK